MKLRIGLVVALLSAGSFGCGSYSSMPSAPSPTTSTSTTTSGTTVSIVSGADVRGANAYAPNPITVAVGGTVTWTNNDSTTHTSTGDNGTWDSGNVAPGRSFSKTFASAGSFTYHCTIHPGMVGTVSVQ